MSAHGKIENALLDLNACDGFIKNGNQEQARSKLNSAIAAIKGVVSDVKRLEREAKK